MATNRLYRDTENGMLGGVAAGLAMRFNLDPTLMRVAFIAMAVVTFGTTLLLYLALWVIIPEADAETEEPRRPSRGELTQEFRCAGGRVAQAGRIVGRHAKEAAGELSHLRGRTVASPPVGDEAAGAQAVNEEVLAGDSEDVGGPGNAGDAGNAGSSEEWRPSAPPPPPSRPWGGDQQPPTPPAQP